MNRTPPVLWPIRLLLIAAMGIAGYLAYASLFTGGAVAGCGGSRLGCGHVLASRWATWFGIPVGLPAIAILMIALGATLLASAPQASRQRMGWALLAGTATLIGGAAIWFVGLQLLSLGNVCWYCVALHGCGLLFAGFVAWQLPRQWIGKVVPAGAIAAGGVAGLLGLVALIGGQWFSAASQSGMHITRVPTVRLPVDIGPKTDVDSAPSTPTESRSDREAEHPWPHRQLKLLGDHVSLDMNDYPVIGNRGARRVLVEVFDYTCTQCRELHAMMHTLLPEFGNELAIVLVPIPLNPDCNRFATTQHEEHATACELTRIALAVWQARPEAFARFHDELMTGATAPGPATAQAAAIELLGEDAFQQALASPTVEAQLQQSCHIYGMARASTGESEIPKLLYDQIATSGMPGSEEELRKFLKTALGGGD